jgi:hypothetical protein
MDMQKMKDAIDIDTARAFRAKSPLEMAGLVAFLRQEIVHAEWAITRHQQAISAYQAVIDKIEQAARDHR